MTKSTSGERAGASSEPDSPTRWPLGKVLFEKWWHVLIGWKRDMIGWAVKAGGDFYGIHAAI